MDLQRTDLESSETHTCYGQLMVFEEEVGKREVENLEWSGRLHQHTLSFSSHNVQFLTLDVQTTPEYKPPASVAKLMALAKTSLGCKSEVVPCVPVGPYPQLPLDANPNQGVVGDKAPAVPCRMCPGATEVSSAMVRTHIGQHMLRGHCLSGEEALPLGQTCGVCGSRSGRCTLKIVT